ncbi:MAG: glycosyltransferase family 39 protein [Syntrophaceae bacterium]|nr:glycosyltransferase family 39 protein [Syntrophaceae bacterium]
MKPSIDQKPFRVIFVLLLFILILQVLSIWKPELSGRDSPRVAGIAREMAVTSNYLIPRLNGENFLEYPPLGYWPMAFTLLWSQTPTDFLVFIPIIFFGVGTVLVTYFIGRKLASGRIGLMAGFILSSMPAFISLHRHCRVDPVLLFFITLSLYGFISVYQKDWRKVPFFTVFYLAMSGAFLTKGIIGLAIPIAIAMVFLITRKDFRGIRKLLLNPGILLFFLPLFLWAGSVWWIEGSSILKEVVRQSLQRFLSPSADHAKPFYYYFIPAFLSSMPWTILLFVLLWSRWKPIPQRETGSDDLLLRFTLIWSLTVFIGLSLASAKRPIYLAPIFPPFALLAALGWDYLREKFPKLKRWELYGLLIIFLIYIGIYLFFITPKETKESLRPVFKAVSIQQTRGPIYLVNPSEALRGASFFYLGEKIPVLSLEDLLLGRFEDRSGTTLLLDAYLDDSRYGSHIRSRGYRLILKQKFGKDAICVYSAFRD